MPVVTHNATSLAWIGDALMTLEVRKALVAKGYQKADVLQKKSAKILSAKGQAKILQKLLDEDYFNEEEKVILRRGRNATIHSKAKNADGKTYLQATSLEALLGYLELYGYPDRLKQCLKRIVQEGENL